MIAPGELFPPYLHTGRAWGPSPLADLHAGGTIMWIGSDLIMTIFAVALAMLMIHGSPAAGRADVGNDDTRLVAYNAYLASLAGRGRPSANRPPRHIASCDGR